MGKSYYTTKQLQDCAKQLAILKQLKRKLKLLNKRGK